MKNVTMPDVMQRLQIQKTIQELISEFLDHIPQPGFPPKRFSLFGLLKERLHCDLFAAL
jgi:hypothetical protein